MIARLLAGLLAAAALAPVAANAQPRSREVLDEARVGSWDVVLIRDNLEQQTISHIQSRGTGPAIVIVCTANIFQVHFDLRRAFFLSDLVLTWRTDVAPLQHDKLYSANGPDTQRLDAEQRPSSPSVRFVAALLRSRELYGEISDGRRGVRLAHEVSGLDAALRAAAECGELRRALEATGTLMRPRPLSRPAMPN